MMGDRMVMYVVISLVHTHTHISLKGGGCRKGEGGEGGKVGVGK